MSLLERYNHMNESRENGTKEGNEDTQKTKADYSICDKMSVSEMYINTSIVDYLFEQGKCGDICKDGKE